MRHLWPAIVLIVGCQNSSAQNVDVGSDPKGRESYSLGYQLGTSLKKQETSIQLDVYVAGLRDGLAGKPARVNAKELETAVATLREKAVAAQQKTLVEKNRAAGAAFLEANKKRDGVKILPSGLQYRILEEGKGASAGAVNSVTVNYRSTFVDGKELSSSFASGKPMTVDLQRVIPAWREAIPLMKEGAKWELVVPPTLAYGSRGSTGIGPDSTLIFQVELLKANASVVAKH